MIRPDFYLRSSIGGRENNEDACLAKSRFKRHLFIVADGLGGHKDGQIASRTAVNSIADFLWKNKKSEVTEAIEIANEAVKAAQEAHNSRMKTTVAVAYYNGDQAFLAHVGDTRIYAFSNGKISFRTVDHSASQLAVFSGEITEDQIRGHEDRNLLIRTVGAADTVKADVTVAINSQFDALLLCTDGFWEYVLENEMEETLARSKSAKAWVNAMTEIHSSRAPSDCDNNTALAVIFR
jgi:serine/threonine protein phosphatase PrpC